MPRIAVFGAGAIGCWVGGRLSAGGADVTLIGRQRVIDELGNGLKVSDVHGGTVETKPALATAASGAAAAELVLVTVKSAASAEAGRELAPVLAKDAVVVSFQNGVRNPELLQAALPSATVLAGMVPFNVARKGDTWFHQGTSGRLAVAARGQHHVALIAALERAGLPASAHADMRGIQWGKLLVNLNNSVNALSGLPLLQQIGQRAYRKIMAACVREGLRVLRKTDIEPVVDAPIPASWVPPLMELPDALFRLAAKPMIAIDPNARSSMWEDLQRGRKTEVDFLNGEIVRLGTKVHVPTPINARIVELVRAAEAKGSPPSMSAAELARALY